MDANSRNKEAEPETPKNPILLVVDLRWLLKVDFDRSSWYCLLHTKFFRIETFEAVVKTVVDGRERMLASDFSSYSIGQLQLSLASSLGSSSLSNGMMISVYESISTKTLVLYLFLNVRLITSQGRKAHGPIIITATRRTVVQVQYLYCVYDVVIDFSNGE